MTQEKEWWKIERDENNVENSGNLEFDINQLNIQHTFERGRKAGRLEMAEEIKKMIESSTFHEVCDKNIEDIGNKILDVLKKKLITRIQYGITHLKNEEK